MLAKFISIVVLSCTILITDAVTVSSAVHDRFAIHELAVNRNSSISKLNDWAKKLKVSLFENIESPLFSNNNILANTNFKIVTFTQSQVAKGLDKKITSRLKEINSNDPIKVFSTLNKIKFGRLSGLKSRYAGVEYSNDKIINADIFLDYYSKEDIQKNKTYVFTEENTGSISRVSNLLNKQNALNSNVKNIDKVISFLIPLLALFSVLVVWTAFSSSYRVIFSERNIFSFIVSVVFASIALTYPATKLGVIVNICFLYSLAIFILLVQTINIIRLRKQNSRMKYITSIKAQNV